MTKAPDAARQGSRFQKAVHVSAVSCPQHEATVRGMLKAWHLENWKGLLEGVLQNMSDVVKLLWWGDRCLDRTDPPNYGVKLPVRSAAGLASARTAVGRPAAYALR